MIKCVYVIWIAFILLCLKSFGQSQTSKLTIEQLTRNFYVYTTYHAYEGSLIPANGMYVVTDAGVVLFDTPWDTTQFRPLLDSIYFKHRKKVVLCLATHWHSDRTAGLEYYQQRGIDTYTSVLTDYYSFKNNKKRAAHLIANDTTFMLGGFSFETFYPGEGHTADNIVVWFKKERILYGGCLIKGVDAKDLGYLGDANVQAYETTLRRVEKKCKLPKWIVVSHSDWRNNQRALKHSIQLARQLKQSNYG